MSLRSTERRKWERRERRAGRVRSKMLGTPERPRLTVYRSHRHFHCQIIDDTNGRTITSASTLQKDLRPAIPNGGDVKAAVKIGEAIAARAKEKGVAKVVFDRNFYRFHGRVRAFAEAASKGGLLFLVNPDKPEKKPKAPKAEKAAAPEKKKEKKEKKEGRPPKEKAPAAGESKG